MILADTSIWVSYLRSGYFEHRQYFAAFLTNNQIAINWVIQAEILNGVARKDFYRLKNLLEAVTFLPFSKDEENDVFPLMWEGKQQNYRFGLPDLMIAASARRFHLPVWSGDSDLHRLGDMDLIKIFKL